MVMIYRVESVARTSANKLYRRYSYGDIIMTCFCGCETYVKDSDGFKIGCVKCNHGPQNHEESFKINPITEGTQKRGSLS